MRARFAALTLLLPLLASCQAPDKGDYWARSTAGQTCVGQPESVARTPGDQTPTFQDLMAKGTRANLAGHADDAEKLFRDALALQQKAYPRPDHPCLALPEMSLALQLSAAGKYAEAAGQFANADRALHAADDPAITASMSGAMAARLLAELKNDEPNTVVTDQVKANIDAAAKAEVTAEMLAMRARLLHYQGIDLLNQRRFREAEAELLAAQLAYTNPESKLISYDELHSQPIPRSVRNHWDVNASVQPGVAERPKILTASKVEQPSLLGLIEVLRYRAIALRHLDRQSDANRLTLAADHLAMGNALDRPSVLARLFLTSGLTASSSEKQQGASAGTAEAVLRDQLRALGEYEKADVAFNKALHQTRPAAEAALIHAAELVQADQPRAAASQCRRAVEVLRTIGAGTTPELMAPCLEAYAAGGSSNDDDMFVAAQVAQGTITSHQIAQASAALADSKSNPKIVAALQARDALQRQVDQYDRELDTIGPATSGLAAARVAQLQGELDRAQPQLAAAEQAVREASPNFSQLVQDVVPPSAVYQQLHPGEAFVSVFLSRSDGWVFVLRDGHISRGRIEGGASVIDPLVIAVRKGLEQTVPNVLPTVDIDSTRRLYDLTLGTVKDKLAGATALVIAPTGRLLSLPFEVLLTGPADPDNLAKAPWLVRQATITHVPAPANFVTLRQVAFDSKASKPWFGFGGFQLVTLAQADRGFPPAKCGNAGALLAGLDPLQGARAELEAARQILGASDQDELLGPNFTPPNVMKDGADLLSQYRILHFATHALLPTDLTCQTEAAIVASAPAGSADAKDALLDASRLLDLKLDANLVILSACNSGGPGGGAGESLSGLARSFFYVHARSLLVTHWDVSDQFAPYLIANTLNNLKKKPYIGITGALRDAQLKALDQAAKGELAAQSAHPFFWAPFAVIGEGGEQPNRTTVSSSQ